MSSAFTGVGRAGGACGKGLRCDLWACYNVHVPHSAEDFENSRLFLIFFIIGFPILFAAIWCFVVAITSRMSGWDHLKKRYAYKGEDALHWQDRGGGGVYRESFPFAGARGKYSVGAAEDGLIIKPPLLFRPIYGNLFLPFDLIKSESERPFLGLEFVMIEMQDAPDVRVAILKSARHLAKR